jgi:hypothetical protein
VSRQLALGRQPVLVARWAEALAVAEAQPHLNRLLLVDAGLEEPLLPTLVQAAAARGCALVVCLGQGAQAVHHTVGTASEGAGQRVAISWHDPKADAEAALDAFSIFSTWVGGTPGLSLLVTEDTGLESILDAARTLRQRLAPT